MNGKIRKAAYAADGRSRRCAECKLQPCRPAIYTACTKAFIEGFSKGEKWRRIQNRKGINK